ncbi:MAG: radical SAM protein, partial [Candidatus Aminicenantaceae bacterium]
MKKVILSTICPGTEDIQLALYYLKAYFNKYSTFTDSVEIEVIPFLPRQKPADTAKKLTEKNPDILGFSCYVWNIIDTLKICRYVKKAVPKVRIILGGPEVSPRATEILSNNRSVDVVVIGEGEETFKEVSEYFLFGRKSLETIDGIVYRVAKKVIPNKKRAVIEDLDTIPSPYLQGLIDMNKYQSISTETHRGCLFRCHYCYYHKEFNQIRYFSLPRVERELAFILKKNPIGVYFMDPTFNADKERAKEVLRTFIKYNKTTRLHLELRAEFLDEETVELLH